ncbi:hypothetical protein ADUPG1_004326, partial [Aduncisulcus paluster]
KHKNITVNSSSSGIAGEHYTEHNDTREQLPPGALSLSHVGSIEDHHDDSASSPYHIHNLSGISETIGHASSHVDSTGVTGSTNIISSFTTSMSILTGIQQQLRRYLIPIELDKVESSFFSDSLRFPCISMEDIRESIISPSTKERKEEG